MFTIEIRMENNLKVMKALTCHVIAFGDQISYVRKERSENAARKIAVNALMPSRLLRGPWRK